MDTSFDRGEVDRASLEATERLRQRLAQERDRGRSGASNAGGRRLLPWALAGGLLLFSGGMIASPWFEANVRSRLPFAQEAAVVAAPDTSALERRLAALETRKEVAPPPDERLARTEAKVETSTDLLAREADRIDNLTSEVAALSAKVSAEQARETEVLARAEAATVRTEAMLAVMLARRALDSGRPLGAIEAPLRRAFDSRYPAAVRAIIAAGAAPVTTARLQRDLMALGALAGEDAGQGQGWWDVFSRRVTRLVRPAQPSTDPSLRALADAALARGDVEAAVAQLRRLPSPRTAAVDRWLAAAERLAAAEDALRQLETAALLPPPAPVLQPAADTPKPDAAAPKASPGGRPRR